MNTYIELSTCPDVPCSDAHFDRAWRIDTEVTAFTDRHDGVPAYHEEGGPEFYYALCERFGSCALQAEDYASKAQQAYRYLALTDFVRQLGYEPQLKPGFHAPQLPCSRR